MNKLELAQWVNDYAIKNGASEVEVNISNQRRVEITLRDDEIEKLKESTQNSLSLDIYVANKYSGHSTNNLKKSELESFIKEAIASTKYLTPDMYRVLPDPKYYPKDFTIDLGVVDKTYDQLTTDKRIKIAQEIIKAAREQSDKIVSATGSVSDSVYHSIKVLSNGFSGERSGTHFSVSSGVTVKDGENRPNDYDWASSHFFNQLPPHENIGIEATRRALQKIGKKKIESGKYDMLVENRTVGRLLYMLLGPMYARSIQQKNSFLDGKIGSKIASNKLTVIDDPFIKGGMGSRLYDSSGIALQKRTMIEKGVLKEIFVDNYYGRKLGMEPTASRSSNLVLDYGDKSLQELIKTIDKGILVTTFNGGNSNSTTGDFSYGIGGMLIEKGVLTKPISEMNISGNANDFWQKLIDVGNDVNTYSSWRMASLLFKDIEFSGL